MKKLVALAFCCATAAILLTSCSGSGASGEEKLGLGVVTSIDSSAAATDEAGSKGQVDSLIAAVTVDASGKITKCRIDSAQTVVQFSKEGAIESDVSAIVKSKYELKDEYGMKVASGIGKEWYEQADAFAAWCVGKTVDQVTGLQVKAVNEEHTAVPDIPELAASVTISVEDFIKAVEKAVAN
ncbi:MAG: hypothetical protein LBQ68_00290, partial [Clostridiales bacterium]|nr:hypothetical protein [Clostridiales bacterium]